MIHAQCEQIKTRLTGMPFWSPTPVLPDSILLPMMEDVRFVRDSLYFDLLLSNSIVLTKIKTSSLTARQLR